MLILPLKLPQNHIQSLNLKTICYAESTGLQGFSLGPIPPCPLAKCGKKLHYSLNLLPSIGSVSRFQWDFLDGKLSVIVDRTFSMVAAGIRPVLSSMPTQNAQIFFPSNEYASSHAGIGP